MSNVRQVIYRDLNSRSVLGTGRITFLLVFTALLSGCDSETDYEPFVEGMSQGLFAGINELWDPGQVDVCWENPSAAPNEERVWVRDAIARTWSFAGDLEFTGWGTCNTNSNGVRILLADAPPGAMGLGTDIDGMGAGLILPHTFLQSPITQSLYPDYSFTINCTDHSTDAQYKECIENIAIHEFGHVVGFDHEQNAPGASSDPDFPTGCASLVLPAWGDTLYNNEWDLDSVMNYCNPAYMGPRLSKLDFEGMQHFYGMSPRYVAAVIAILPT